MRSHVWPVLAALLSSCATASPPVDPVKSLRGLAASDLSCPEHLLQIAALGAETFGPARVPLYEEVQGCGLNVIYVATESGYVLSAPKSVRPAREPERVDVR